MVLKKIKVKSFSTLKILATVKQEVTIRFDAFGFSTLKILAYKYEMISND